MIMAATYIASERRHAHSAINTIQADRRSVVQEMPTTLPWHLGEMRLTLMYSIAMSHISNMQERHYSTGTLCSVMSHVSDMHEERHIPYSTTLRSARMVLLVPVGTSHVSDMVGLIPPSESDLVHGATTLRMVLLVPVGTSHVSDMMRQSVLEEVLLLDFHAILGQKLTVLLGKRRTTMMLFLLGDIAHYYVLVAQAIRKARILFGPSIEKREMRVGFEPLAGGDFDFLHELGHRQSGRQGNKEMHMVRHTADTVKTASDIIDKPQHIRIEFPLMLFSNGRNASMGSEDDMIECLCVTHITVTGRCWDYCDSRISPRCFSRRCTLCHIVSRSHCTTLRDSVACMVLIPPNGVSHVSDMFRPLIASKRRHAQSAINTIQAQRSVVATPYKRSAVW